MFNLFKEQINAQEVVQNEDLSQINEAEKSSESILMAQEKISKALNRISQQS